MGRVQTLLKRECAHEHFLKIQLEINKSLKKGIFLLKNEKSSTQYFDATLAYIRAKLLVELNQVSL